MIKIIIIMYAVFLVNSGCNNSTATKDGRRAIIDKAVIAISKYDTLQLYQLIDTSRCFNIYSREGFLDKIDYVYKHLKICGSRISDSAIKIEKEQPYHTKYNINFSCFSGQAKDNSFSLVFSFSDYRKDEVIDFMDIVFHREVKTNTILPPPGTAN
jgi:hypothetical protein